MQQNVSSQDYSALDTATFQDPVAVNVVGDGLRESIAKHVRIICILELCKPDASLRKHSKLTKKAFVSKSGFLELITLFMMFSMHGCRVIILVIMPAFVRYRSIGYSDYAAFEVSINSACAFRQHLSMVCASRATYLGSLCYSVIRGRVFFLLFTSSVRTMLLNKRLSGQKE